MVEIVIENTVREVVINSTPIVREVTVEVGNSLSAENISLDGGIIM